MVRGAEGGGGLPAEPPAHKESFVCTERRPGRQPCATFDARAPGRDTEGSARGGGVGRGTGPLGGSSPDPTWWWLHPRRTGTAREARSVGGPGAAARSTKPPRPASAGGRALEGWKVEETTDWRTRQESRAAQGLSGVKVFTRLPPGSAAELRAPGNRGRWAPAVRLFPGKKVGGGGWGWGGLVGEDRSWIDLEVWR